MTDHGTGRVTDPGMAENLTNVVAKLVGFRRGDRLTVRELLDVSAVLAGAALLAGAASAVLEWRRHREAS